MIDHLGIDAEVVQRLLEDGAKAAKAQESADGASSQATEARTLAQKGLDRGDEVERTLSAKVENMDNYKLLSTGTVLFGLDKSELTTEAKAQLDAEVQKIGSNQHFLIQVEGFDLVDQGAFELPGEIQPRVEPGACQRGGPLPDHHREYPSLQDSHGGLWQRGAGSGQLHAQGT